MNSPIIFSDYNFHLQMSIVHWLWIVSCISNPCEKVNSLRIDRGLCKQLLCDFEILLLQILLLFLFLQTKSLNNSRWKNCNKKIKIFHLNCIKISVDKEKGGLQLVIFYFIFYFLVYLCGKDWKKIIAVNIYNNTKELREDLK